MQNCTKCHTPLSIIEGEYRDYAYCSSCLIDILPVYTGICCKKPDIQPVQAIIANGTIQIREQCQHCKCFNRTAISRSKFEKPEDLPKVQFLSYQEQVLLKETEFTEKKVFLVRLKQQKMAPTSILFITPSTENKHQSHLETPDLQIINDLLDSIYQVFVEDWSFTYSMLSETDGWHDENSPFTTEDQNWHNMTE